MHNSNPMICDEAWFSQKDSVSGSEQNPTPFRPYPENRHACQGKRI
jgi:hypothetical protein